MTRPSAFMLQLFALWLVLGALCIGAAVYLADLDEAGMVGMGP